METCNKEQLIGQLHKNKMMLMKEGKLWKDWESKERMLHSAWAEIEKVPTGDVRAKLSMSF